MKPKPKRRPPKGEVAFEWGLLGANDDALQMYVVRASGVTRWTLDGEWDKDAEVSFVRDAEGNAPVVLHQQIPGLFALECEQITVERGPQKRYAPPPAPSDREFVVWGPTEVCLRELLDWVSPPTDVLVFEQRCGGKGNRRVEEVELDAVIKSPHFDSYRLQRAADCEDPWLWVRWMLAITTVGHYVCISRGTLDDEAWQRVRRLPGKLGDCMVVSGTVRCTGQEWVERFAR